MRDLTEARRGDWIQTYTGRQFWPMDARPEDIDILDIAHALSMQCRFAGHCLRFYSVAEHSVHVASVVDPEHGLWALLHDASEAYLIDVPRPVKPFLPGYREAEDAVMRAVCTRFALPPEMPAPVKAADRAILTDEQRQNMAAPPVEWSTNGPPLGVNLQFWTPDQARRAFMMTFRQLTPAGRSALSSHNGGTDGGAEP